MKSSIIILFLFLNHSYGEQLKEVNDAKIEIIKVSKVLNFFADGLMVQLDLPECNENIPKSGINLVEFNSPSGMADGFNKVIYRLINKEGNPIYFISISGGLGNLSKKYGQIVYDDNSKTISALTFIKVK